MSKMCLPFLMVAMILVSIPAVEAESSIRNLEVVQNLPDRIVTGDTYEMKITFDSTARESLPIVVELDVACAEAPIGYGEILLNSINLNDANLGFEEVEPGYFVTEEGTIPPRSNNELILTVSSVINLMPGTYTFTVSFLTESVTITTHKPKPSTTPSPPPKEPEQPPEEPTPPEEPEEPEVPPEEPEQPEEPEEPTPPEEPPEEPEQPPEEPPDEPEVPEEPEPFEKPIHRSGWPIVIILSEAILAIVTIWLWRQMDNTTEVQQ